MNNHFFAGIGKDVMGHIMEDFLTISDLGSLAQVSQTNKKQVYGSLPYRVELTEEILAKVTQKDAWEQHQWDKAIAAFPLENSLHLLWALKNKLNYSTEVNTVQNFDKIQQAIIYKYTLNSKNWQEEFSSLMERLLQKDTPPENILTFFNLFSFQIEDESLKTYLSEVLTREKALKLYIQAGADPSIPTQRFLKITQIDLKKDLASAIKEDDSICKQLIEAKRQRYRHQPHLFFRNVVNEESGIPPALFSIYFPVEEAVLAFIQAGTEKGYGEKDALKRYQRATYVDLDLYLVQRAQLHNDDTYVPKIIEGYRQKCESEGKLEKLFGLIVNSTYISDAALKKHFPVEKALVAFIQSGIEGQGTAASRYCTVSGVNLCEHLTAAAILNKDQDTYVPEIIKAYRQKCECEKTPHALFGLIVNSSYISDAALKKYFPVEEALAAFIQTAPHKDRFGEKDALKRYFRAAGVDLDKHLETNAQKDPDTYVPQIIAAYRQKCEFEKTPHALFGQIVTSTYISHEALKRYFPVEKALPVFKQTIMSREGVTNRRYKEATGVDLYNLYKNPPVVPSSTSPERRSSSSSSNAGTGNSKSIHSDLAPQKSQFSETETKTTPIEKSNAVSSQLLADSAPSSTPSERDSSSPSSNANKGNSESIHPSLAPQNSQFSDAKTAPVEKSNTAPSNPPADSVRAKHSVSSSTSPERNSSSPPSNVSKNALRPTISVPPASPSAPKPNNDPLKQKKERYLNQYYCIQRACLTYLDFHQIERTHGIRCLTRWSHFFHGASGMERVKELLEQLNTIINMDNKTNDQLEKDHEILMKALLVVCEASSTTIHSFNHYITEAQKHPKEIMQELHRYVQNESKNEIKKFPGFS